MPTFSQLQIRVLNHIRRQPAELITELPNIINNAQDEICQRRQYWFLEQSQNFSVTVGVGSWWVLTLPLGASYSTLPDDVMGLWEQPLTGPVGQTNPVEYLPYEQAITIYPNPSSTSIRGPIEAFSETLDYTGLILWPVPIKNTNFFLRYRAKSLPDWDGISVTAHNVLTDEYTNVFEEWIIALCWKFLGELNKFQARYTFADQLCKKTIDRENVRKKWLRVSTLPQRKGMEIPRQKQFSPFRKFL